MTAMHEPAAPSSAPPPESPLPRESKTTLVPAMIPPASGYEKAAWIMLAAGLIFVLEFKLLPALLAGLFVHSLVHVLAGRMSGKNLSHSRAKIVAVALIGLVIVGIATALILLLIGFLQGKLG